MRANTLAAVCYITGVILILYRIRGNKHWHTKRLFKLHSQHYANTPMQYTAIFHGCKNVNFQMTNYNIFLIHCLDRAPDCTFLGTGLLLPRWRTGKPARGRYLFYNHFISILIVIQYQRPDLRTLYAFHQSSLVSLSQKSHRYGYGGIISSVFVYILIF